MIDQAETTNQYIMMIALKVRNTSPVSHPIESIAANEVIELMNKATIVGHSSHVGELLIASRLDACERQQQLSNYQLLLTRSDNLVTAECGYVCTKVNLLTLPDQLIAAASEWIT